MKEHSIRARVRRNHQVTIPPAVCAALLITPGDEVQFTMSEYGDVILRGYRAVPIESLPVTL